MTSARWRALGHGVQVTHFTRGRDAVSYLAALEPPLASSDVIVVDLGLPDVRGVDVIRSIRGMPGGQRPTIVALTTSERARDIVTASAAGIDHYYVKPRSAHGLRTIAARLRQAAAVPGRT